MVILTPSEASQLQGLIQAIPKQTRDAFASKLDKYKNVPPGKSLHEQGLAIDFTCNGNTLRDTDPCHAWLVHNAHRYGYKPYSNDYYGAVEPWHWSTTGR